jgi:hypothetical protein
MHYRPNDGTIDITDEKAFLSLFEKNVHCVSPKNEFVLSYERLTGTETEIIFMERGR